MVTDNVHIHLKTMKTRQKKVWNHHLFTQKSKNLASMCCSKTFDEIIGNKQTTRHQQYQRQPQNKLHHPQQYQFDKNKIIGLYTNEDILYCDGISTPFYHCEPLRVHRRGQREAFKDSISVAKKV